MALLCWQSACVPSRWLFFPCTCPTFDSEVHLPFRKAIDDLIHTIVANSADNALFPSLSGLVSCSLDGKQSFNSRSYKCCVIFSPEQFCIPYFWCLLPNLITGRLLKKEDEALNRQEVPDWRDTVNPKWPEGPHNLLI